MLIKFHAELGNNAKWYYHHEFFEGYTGVFDILRNFWETLPHILSALFINFQLQVNSFHSNPYSIRLIVVTYSWFNDLANSFT